MLPQHLLLAATDGMSGGISQQVQQWLNTDSTYPQRRLLSFDLVLSPEFFLLLRFISAPITEGRSKIGESSNQA
eukprot:3208522-Rhodomonas_salina.1